MCINDIHCNSCTYLSLLHQYFFSDLYPTTPRFIAYLTSTVNLFHWPHYIVPPRIILSLVSWLTTVSLLSSLREMVLRKPWNWLKLIGYSKHKLILANHSDILVKIPFHTLDISPSTHLPRNRIHFPPQMLQQMFIPQLHEIILTSFRTLYTYISWFTVPGFSIHNIDITFSIFKPFVVQRS
jgi:hypothetical protein